jgi:branched-subunit amino acid ABC-type transport system permease component
MSVYLNYAILGIGAGAVYALLGLGLVLTYRGSGVINFSHGAIAMYVTFVFAYLRERGEFIIPIPGLPRSIHLTNDDTGLGFWLAFFLSIIFAALLGALIYFLVFRPLRRAPILAKVVASVGLLLTLQVLIQARFDTDKPPIAPILPQGTINLGGPVGQDRLWFGVITVLITTICWLVYRYTRFGLATRGAAENEKGATLLGFSPDATALTNWIIAAVLAGVAGIMISPTVPLSTYGYTFFVIPALGAALVANFTSFWITMITGLAIGIGQSELTKLATVAPTIFNREGMTDALPFLIIIAVVFFRGTGLPTRATLSEGRMPFAHAPGKWKIPGAAMFALVVGLSFIPLDWNFLSFDFLALRGALVKSLIGGMMALSVVVLTGYVGQISLAQLSLAGIASFSLFRIGTTLHIPFPIAPIVSVVIATIVGILIGIPALRVRGVTLAIITLAAAYAIERFAFRAAWLIGGLSGNEIQAPKVGPIDLSVSTNGDINRPAFTIFCLIVLSLLAIAVVNLRSSMTGQRMLAVRANERAAAAAGINVARTKLLAFAISSAIAGTAGVMAAYNQINLSGDSYNALLSITVLAFAYLGGISTVSGALLAGALSPGGMTSWINTWLGTRWPRLEFLSKYELLLGAVGLITTSIVNNEGIAGATIARSRKKRELKVSAQAATDFANVEASGATV